MQTEVLSPKLLESNVQENIHLIPSQQAQVINWFNYLN